MEYIPGGQLKRLFSRNLTDLQASQVIKSLIQGIAYIHERQIVHRDIKPDNILLQRDDNDCLDVKIVDFGLSAVFNLTKGATEKAGTLSYMAPEQIANSNYSKKVDIWATGIIMWKLLAGGDHPLYTKGDSQSYFFEKLQYFPMNSYPWKFPPRFSRLARDFFVKLCSYPASQRYDARQALKHPWITRTSDDEIPLTQKEQLSLYDTETELRKIARLAFFVSVAKSKLK